MSIRKHGSAEQSVTEVPAVEVEGSVNLRRTASGSGWSASDEAGLEEENVAADEE